MKINRRSALQVMGISALIAASRRAVARSAPSQPSVGCEVVAGGSDAGAALVLASPGQSAKILIDPADFRVVHIAARMLAEDLFRVTGEKPQVITTAPTGGHVVIIGTSGACRWIDQLAAKGEINTAAIRNRWEASLRQTVDRPLPGVDRALVIVGSDRRGTAYGVMDLCEAAGVSPWFWWADVPVRRARTVAVTAGIRQGGSPAVKYRGIFINDEDWGFEPWAAKTFDPKLGNVGPKTYEKVFDLMLRLKLNYLWPAMHNCSTPFAAIRENAVLADDYAIVMGSSHVEPMLATPGMFLDHRRNGPWNFVTNGGKILKFWRQSAETRGKYEAVWTLGMRGPYDSPLEGVHSLAQERTLVEKIFRLQQRLIGRYVTRRWGPPAECYVPYKEALLLFNSGLKVPPDVTIVWPDNNFGYIRQLPDARQRQRPGGSGVYYHVEYLGAPHSYCWLDTTPPALMWEELKKAWDNQARTIWVINVGGIKPREIGVDFAARLAWNPQRFGPDAQEKFLKTFATGVCGPGCGEAVADLMREYYILGQIRKPEYMNRYWAGKLPDATAAELLDRYHRLLIQANRIGARIPKDANDAWFELFAYPVQMFAATGLIFLYDRNARMGIGERNENLRQVEHWRSFIERQVWWYNNRLADGKWKYYATMGGTTYHAPWAVVEWPWLKSQERVAVGRPEAEPIVKFAAADFVHQKRSVGAVWQAVAGLGWSGRAMALWPAVPQNRWNPVRGLSKAPQMRYEVRLPHEVAHGEVVAHVLPTYELYPGMKLRIALGWDDQPVRVLEVPYASSETRVVGNAVRSHGVLVNHIPLRMRVGPMDVGRHVLTVYAVDPGLVLDQITIEAGKA